MEKRLNIRLPIETYRQLQEIKRAIGLIGDSGCIRGMIEDEHATLTKAGAFKTVEKLAQQTQPASYHSRLADATTRRKKRQKAKGLKSRGLVIPGRKNGSKESKRSLG